LSDWNAQPPDFGGRRFDAIVCAHFIEHIARPESLVEWAARKLRPGGRIYVEWPAPVSLALPKRDALERAGVNVMISHFNDDRTHRDLPDADAIVDAMHAAGLALETRGTVRLPWLEDEILAHHKDDAGGFGRQAAFWSMTGWSQYLIASRI
jgi:SAM-dependent methyltransferase